MDGKEMENIIKFDRKFKKLLIQGLPGLAPDKGILLDVIEGVKPSETFIKYDTLVEDEKEEFNEPFTISPYDEYLLLVFYDELFCFTFLTLRKDTKENRLKYMRNIGKVFKVEIQR